MVMNVERHARRSEAAVPREPGEVRDRQAVARKGECQCSYGTKSVKQDSVRLEVIFDRPFCMDNKPPGPFQAQ